MSTNVQLDNLFKKSFPLEELEMSMKAKPAMRAVTAETVGSGDLMIMRCNDVLKRKMKIPLDPYKIGFIAFRVLASSSTA